MAFRVGVDYGGTWLRILALQPSGAKKFSLRIPAPPPEKLAQTLRKILSRKKIQPLDSLVIGARGFWKQSKRRSLQSQLKGIAPRILILSDVEMAHRAAFGDSGGILLIAGTGSIAYGRNIRGKWARAGGLGPQKGDEGSGYWIGKQFLQRSGRKIKSGAKVRQVAQFAKAVIGKAARKNPGSQAIAQESQQHLARLVDAIAKKVSFPSPLKVSLAGGLFDSAYFRKGFVSLLRKRFGNRELLISFSTSSNNILRAKLQP